MLHFALAGDAGLERVEAQRYQHPGGSAGPEHAPQRAGSQVTPSRDHLVTEARLASSILVTEAPPTWILAETKYFYF